VFVAAVKFITEILRSNDMGIHMQTHGLMEVPPSDGFRCHDIHTEFHKDWFRHSKVDCGGDTQTHRQNGDLINLLLFFQSEERRTIKSESGRIITQYLLTFHVVNDIYILS
jgi:hypothetical protein